MSRPRPMHRRYVPNLDLFAEASDLGREPTTDDHCTPPEIVERILAMGEIDLDPCSNPSSIVPARERVMLPDNGLCVSWARRGLIFCNPPYSNPLPWAKKWLDADEALMLVSTQTGTAWGSLLLATASAVCFFDHRLHFYLNGVRQPSAQFSSMMVYRGRFPRTFGQCFYTAGNVLPCGGAR